MKGATEEFSLTAVTIVAIMVIAGLVAWLSPKIAKYVQDNWSNATNTTVCPDGQYLKNGVCTNIEAGGE